MDTIARLITLVFDGLVVPFGSHRTAALLALSVVGGAFLTVVFHLASNPTRIRRTRDRFQARILELRLYPDDIVLMTRALLGALGAQLDYLRASAKPILLVTLLALPWFFQVESRFARRPLHVPEEALVTAVLKPGLDARSVPATLTGSRGLVVDPRPVRVRAERAIVWRVKTAGAGAHPLTARVYDNEYQFAIRAQEDTRALGERRSGAGWDAFVHAGLPPIPPQSALHEIRVSYPDAIYPVLGARVGWLVVFLVGSLLGAVIPARLLRIPL